MRKYAVAACAMIAACVLTVSAQPPGQPPGGGKGKGGGFGGGGQFKGKGQPGGFGGFRPGTPGEVMPAFLQEQLKLNEDQKKQVADLQKEVDGKLDKILTEDQKTQLKQMRERGPRGGAFPGGPGGGFNPKGGPVPKDPPPKRPDGE